MRLGEYTFLETFWIWISSAQQMLWATWRNFNMDVIYSAINREQFMAWGTKWHGGHWLRKGSGNRETTKSIEYGKCLKTGEKQQNCLKTGEKQQNFLLAKKNVTNRGHRMTRGSLITESVWKRENDKIPWIRKVSGNRKTAKSLEYGKCPETGKQQNPLNTESVWKQENDKILWISKNVTHAGRRTTF